MTRSLVDLLLGAAVVAPERIALSRRRSSWTYQDIVSGAAAVAARLRREGCQPGDRVALLFRNCPEYVALLYGALAARLTVVPLNVQERAAVLALQVEHSGACLLVGDPQHPEWDALRQVLPPAVPTMAVAAADDWSSATAFRQALDCRGAADLIAPDVARDDLAVLLYTSGTTGRPKGVMLSHGNLAANTTTIINYLDLGPNDVGLTVMPFHFSYGNSVLHTHLCAGARLLIEDTLAYPQVVMRRLADEGVTGFSGVPSTFAILMSRTRMQDFNLGSLRYLTQAGGAMPRAAIERIRQLVPGARLFVMYGQTEATARLTFLDPDRLMDKLGSIGKPLEGVDIEIRGPDGTRLPPNQTGELCARGPNVMLGYWRDEALTRATVVDGWLHTGDLAHADDDGFLYIDGRLVEMIKVGSFRVSPLEVEEVLAMLPGIAEMAVTATPDDLLGQAVKAVLVLREGAELDERRVKAHCRDRLAMYKVPKVVEFVRELPRTSSGKIQRYKLA